MDSGRNKITDSERKLVSGLCPRSNIDESNDVFSNLFISKH